MTADTDPARLALLADPTRRALLRALRESKSPAGVRELAAAVGLHRNSVREQLARLQAAGLVTVTRADPAGRGRPGLRYVATPEPEDPYRVLASVLADQVAMLPDPGTAAQAAGERWGRATAGRAGIPSAGGTGTAGGSGPPSADASLGAVAALLAEAGFAPDPVAPGDDELRLRACPFLPIDPRHLEVVCAVHLGFVRGALRELGSSRDATSIEPFVEPDLCVTRLGRMPNA